MEGKIFEGKGIPMGRLASRVAKELLGGEKILIINCDQVIITGNKKMIEREFTEKRNRIGHSQKGPKHPATSEKIVKRAIRGMLPNFRVGRGKEAFSRVKCYSGVPKELEKLKPFVFLQSKKIKFSEVKKFTK